MMENYNYVLKRSAKRKTISISVQADNSIIVRCPQNTKQGRIDGFLSEKSGWIDAHLRKNKINNKKFSRVLSGKAVLVKGKEVPFALCSKDSFGESGVCLTSFSKLKRAYIDNLGGEFVALLTEISARSNLKYSSVSFRDYKSRWGCCNAKGGLTFNYKLLMLPKELWTYVIVHELCHTLHMNHSAAFRNCVAAVLPDYKKRLASIKEYSFLCAMY